VSPQAKAVLDDVYDLYRLFDFTQGRLADDVALAAAAGIGHAMDSQVDPDGADWAELSERYARWKDAHYPGRPISVLTGHMRDPVQLNGQLTYVSRDRLVQTYGVDDEARQLAAWFQEGDPPHQPPRRFYELNDLAKALVGFVFDARLQSAPGH